MWRPGRARAVRERREAGDASVNELHLGGAPASSLSRLSPALVATLYFTSYFPADKLMYLFRGSVQKEESEGHIFKGEEKGDREEEWVSSRTSGNMERGDEENQAAGYDHTEDQGETEAAGHSETGEPTGSFDGSEPGSPWPESAAASASPAGPSTSAAVPTGPRRRAQRRPREQPSEVERELLEVLRTRPVAPAPRPRSEDELFLLSLVPSLQRMPPQTKDFVKFQIHKLIYENSTVVLNLEQLEPTQ
ncbi:hypothetical protein DPX16_3133 [Anabarilius grahami]|uniref:BESS domain-containing protein n=1 Tax=Anabarilius grahami TaxID=495550 RepID=A0A3N0YPK7_ANAGA|nr:hypothetical protein DPX16_3133 [Anabarilius grahami]